MGGWGGGGGKEPFSDTLVLDFRENKVLYGSA